MLLLMLKVQSPVACEFRLDWRAQLHPSCVGKDPQLFDQMRAVGPELGSMSIPIARER
jgi:hypothetical protein